ncbi:MAG: SPOR domain-containing protein [Deltaproteobacteria bacterium]|jgi:hypothetical protein|nr:SPOR domain-containing protein [Deltaproteobacteria bacterium]
MLRALFLAPGRLLHRRFSQKRRKFRYLAHSAEAGPVLSLSLLFWAAFLVVAGITYANLGGDGATPPMEAALVPAAPPAPVAVPDGAPIAESAPAAPEVVTAPSMAQSAALLPPDAAALENAAGFSAEPLIVPSELRLTPDAAAMAETPEVWLVIVESIPKSARDKAEEALTRQKRKGIDLSLIDTDAYPRLKNGMWALALGPYESKAEADLAAAEIKPKVRDLMVRRGL